MRNSRGLLSCVTFAAWGLAVASAASAQSPVTTVTDAPVITPGDSTTPAPGVPFQVGFTAGAYGSISQAKTLDGYPITAYYDQVRGGKIGGYTASFFAVSGFPSDPGSSWLSSITVNGSTYTGGTYTFSNGTAQWRLGGPVFLNTSGNVQPSIVHGAAIGHLDLRFQIVAVDYAPPGQRSTVNYSNSAMRGTTTTNSDTFTNTLTETATITAGVNLFGFIHGVVKNTASTAYAQETDGSSSIAIQATTTNSVTVPGPASSTIGIDHDYDIVWVWLNPLATFAFGPNTVAWTGYAFNAEDDAQEMEVVPLYVTWLKNPSTIPADVAARLARSWDTSGLGGLTAEDFATILAADPFSSPSFNPNSDAGHRFDLQVGQTFTYSPPANGGQPLTRNYSVQTQTTSTQGHGAFQEYTTDYTVEYDSGASVIAQLQADVKVEQKYVTKATWSSVITNQATQTAALSITGPAVSDNYTGPTTIQIWRDNVYGSFMFYGVP